MAQIAIHPGEHLAEELGALSMSAAELARQLGVPTNRITEILNARRAITYAEFWLNLQGLYEIRLAERRSGKLIRTLPKLWRDEQVHA